MRSAVAEKIEKYCDRCSLKNTVTGARFESGFALGTFIREYFENQVQLLYENSTSQFSFSQRSEWYVVTVVIKPIVHTALNLLALVH